MPASACIVLLSPHVRPLLQESPLNRPVAGLLVAASVAVAACVDQAVRSPSASVTPAVSAPPGESASPSASTSPGPPGSPIVLSSGAAGTPDGTDSALAQALAHAPADVTSIDVIDWAALKAQLAGDELSSSSPDAARAEFMAAAGRVAPVGLSPIAPRFREHAREWGFDPTELDWEATFSSGPEREPGVVPLVALRFREGFDLRALESRFDERGFAREELEGATIWISDPGANEAWAETTAIHLQRTAFLPDGRTLLLAGGHDDGAALAALKRALTGPRADTVGGPLPSLAGAVVPYPAVTIRLSAAACQEPLDPPVAGVAVAFRPDPAPRGRIAYLFDGADTQRGLDARRQMLATGTIAATATPYVDAFEVGFSSTSGGVAVLDVEPTDGTAAPLFSLVVRGDPLVSSCRE
jgi:hypothetical protein